MSRSRSSVPLILFGMTTFAAGQTVMYAMVGPVMREIGLTELHLGIIMSVAAVTWTLAAPAWGRVSDRVGRVKPIVWGLLAYGVGTAVFALLLRAGMAGWLVAAHTFAALVVVRAVAAIMMGGIQPAATAYMADITSLENRSAGVAMVGAAFGLGSVLGPVLGGLLTGFGVLTPLYLAAALSFTAAVAIGLVVRDPPRAAPETKLPRLSPLDIRIRFPVLFALLLFIAMSILQQTSAFYFQDTLRLDTAAAARAIGLAMGGMALAMLLTQALAIRIFKPRPPVMLRLGAILFFIGLVGALVFTQLAGLIASYVLLGLGAGLLTPGVQALASLSVSAEEQGAAAGAVGAGMGAGYIVGPLLGTALYEGSHQWPLTAALITTAAMLAAAWLRPLGAPAPRPA